MGKTGLIMEGGAMRGLFTAGVMDVLLENGITFDGGIGVSAGAAFGCNYVSRQTGRVLRYNLRFCQDWRYCSLLSWIVTGDMYGAEFAFRTVPEKYDIFDADAFEKNPMEFYCVATDLVTGRAVYHKFTDCRDKDVTWLQASASLPIFARPVKVDGRVLLDGGLTDAIPLAYFESIGYDRNVVILTRPLSYRKEPLGKATMAAVELALRRYPLAVQSIRDRYRMYNDEVHYIRQREEEGSAFVIRPFAEVNIGSVCHDRKELRRVYGMGRKSAEERLDALREFLA